MDGLTEEQYKLLYEAENRYEDPVLVERDAVDAVREALGQPLAALGMREKAIENMSLEALAGQYDPAEDDDNDATEALNLLALSQQPESGGQDAAEANAEAAGEEPTAEEEDEKPSIETLSASDRKELERKVHLAVAMADRTPVHAEELKQDALEMSGEDDFDALQEKLSDDSKF